MTEADFNALDWSEFAFRLEMFTKETSEELKRTLVGASFTAWQMRDTGKTFNEYLRIYGLADKSEQITPGLRKKLAKQNIGIAERIRKASKKQRARP